MKSSLVILAFLLVACLQIKAQPVLSYTKAVYTTGNDSLPYRLLYPQRVYITGYSMGGEGAFDLLTRRPQLFAAAIPICPVADTARARFIYQTPVWVFHGEQDDVNDVRYSRLMIAALKKYNGTPIYTEYPGCKHNIWSKAYNEPGLFEWLFEQRRR